MIQTIADEIAGRPEPHRPTRSSCSQLSLSDRPWRPFLACFSTEMRSLELMRWVHLSAEDGVKTRIDEALSSVGWMGVLDRHPSRIRLASRFFPLPTSVVYESLGQRGAGRRWPCSAYDTRSIESVVLSGCSSASNLLRVFVDGSSVGFLLTASMR